MDSPRPTPRRMEVLRLVAEGYGTDDIAQRLQLARSTVKNHREQLLADFDARNMAEAVHRAHLLGMLG